MRNHETWEKQLEESPHPNRGFSKRLEQQIEEQLVKHQSLRFRRKTAMRMLSGFAGGVVILAIVFVMIFSDLPGSLKLGGNDKQPTDSVNLDEDRRGQNDDPVEPDENVRTIDRFFNIETVQVGDTYDGLTVTEIQSAERFLDGTTVTFEGNVTLSGTFKHYYIDANYNPGDVVFSLDEASMEKLPMPDLYEGMNQLQFVLNLDEGENAEELFGPRGTSGEIEINISGYSAFVAEAWGGTVNPMIVEEIVSIETIPPDHPDKLNSDATERLNSYPQLELDFSEWLEEDAWTLAEWLASVQQTFMDGAIFDERRLHPDDREAIAEWMRQVFSESMTGRLLDVYVPETDGGYIVAGGYLGLIPVEELLAIEPRNDGESKAPLMRSETTEAGEEVWVFDAKVNVASPVPWHTIEVTFSKEDDRWVIENFSLQQIR